MVIKRMLPIKNMLIRVHACEVEAAFEKAIGRFGDNAQPIAALDESSVNQHNPSGQPEAKAENTASALTAAEHHPLPLRVPRRRDKAHLKFVATQPCLLCARRPADAHHLRFAQARALGAKVSDEFTVPLCRSHHRQLHRSGNEP